jgi:hypothetical protein
MRPTVRDSIRSVEAASGAPTAATTPAIGNSAGFQREMAPAFAQATESHAAPTKNAAISGKISTSAGPCMNSMTSTCAAWSTPGAVIAYDNVFVKLGISSRTELIRLAGPEASPPGLQSAPSHPAG